MWPLWDDDVSIKDLKDHLSAYLKKVQLGEEMVVTSHDTPVAKIIPITNQNSLIINRVMNGYKKSRNYIAH